MAHGVVEQLEIVEVEEEDGAPQARTFAAGEDLVEFFRQKTPVRQSCQVIEIGQLVNPPFRALALRQVGIRARNAQGFSRGVARDEAARQHRHVMPIAVAHAKFHAVAFPGLGQQLAQETGEARFVVGVQEPRPGPGVARQRTGRVPQHIPPAIGIINLASDEVPVPGRVGGPLHNQAEALFGLLRLALCLLEPGTVGEAHDDALDLPVPFRFALFLALRIGIADEPTNLSRRFGGDPHHQFRHRLATGEHLVHRELLRRHDGAVRAQEGPCGGARRRPDQLLFRPPKQDAGTPVGGKDAAVGTVHDDPCRQVVEQVVELALQVLRMVGRHGVQRACPVCSDCATFRARAKRIERPERACRA